MDRDEARDDYLAGQIGRLDDEMAALRRGNAEMITAAVRDGITQAVSDPALWAAASRAIQHQAKARAGGWLFAGIAKFFANIGWFILAGIAIYMMGGWTALLAYVKTVGPQS